MNPCAANYNFDNSFGSESAAGQIWIELEYDRSFAGSIFFGKEKKYEKKWIGTGRNAVKICIPAAEDALCGGKRCPYRVWISEYSAMTSR